MRFGAALLAAAQAFSIGCSSAPDPEQQQVSASSIRTSSQAKRQADETTIHPSPATFSVCPSEMVSVAGDYCIDRFETSLQDAQARALSPFYHPSAKRATSDYAHWKRKALLVGPTWARQTTVPTPPFWQLNPPVVALAKSQRGVLPNGYLSGELSERACQAVKKRLCSEEEWTRACRGQLDRDFPYGEDYQVGKCNVHRGSHPAALLHGNASSGHLDPRLNLVSDRDGALLSKTGSFSQCASRWEKDAVYDMVGNLDEWVRNENGVFRGGFYSRASATGCQARIAAHPVNYLDYSLGTRCCRNALLGNSP